jgi:hypothetical protein
MKIINTSKKARSAFGYCKHLRPCGKRMANKATRRLARLDCK